MPGPRWPCWGREAPRGPEHTLETDRSPGPPAWRAAVLFSASHLQGGQAHPTSAPGSLCVLLTSGGLGQITPHSPRVSEQNPSGKRLSAAEPGPAREDTALQGQGILWGHASL